MSSWSRTWSSTPTGVAGFNTSPHLQPCSRTSCSERVHVLARLGMERDVRGPRRREISDDPIHRLHHQVHVDTGVHPVVAKRFADQRADRQIRDVMVVHHVEVDHVGAGREHRIDLLAEPGEVRRENRRGDQVFVHRIPRRAGASPARPTFSIPDGASVTRQRLAHRRQHALQQAFILLRTALVFGEVAALVGLVNTHRCPLLNRVAGAAAWRLRPPLSYARSPLPPSPPPFPPSGRSARRGPGTARTSRTNRPRRPRRLHRHKRASRR